MAITALEPYGIRCGGLCSFGQTGVGWFGPHHCWYCYRFVLEACARFRQAVAEGRYDADGYTPMERRAMARKASHGR